MVLAENEGKTAESVDVRQTGTGITDSYGVARGAPVPVPVCQCFNGVSICSMRMEY